MSGKKNPNRQRTDFGKYLLELREDAQLTPSEACKRLRLKSRQRLDNYEVGRTSPSYPTLLKMSQTYHVPIDEILRKAYWPQLILIPLDSLINLEQLNQLSSEDLIKQIEQGLQDSEREKLTKFVENLIYKRAVINRR